MISDKPYARKTDRANTFARKIEDTEIAAGYKKRKVLREVEKLKMPVILKEKTCYAYKTLLIRKKH